MEKNYYIYLLDCIFEDDFEWHAQLHDFVLTLFNHASQAFLLVSILWCIKFFPRVGLAQIVILLLQVQFIGCKVLAHLFIVFISLDIISNMIVVLQASSRSKSFRSIEFIATCIFFILLMNRLYLMSFSFLSFNLDLK